MFHLSLSPVKKEKNGYQFDPPPPLSLIRDAPGTRLDKNESEEVKSKLEYCMNRALPFGRDYGVDCIHKTPPVYRQRLQTIFPVPAPVAGPITRTTGKKEGHSLIQKRSCRNHAPSKWAGFLSSLLFHVPIAGWRDAAICLKSLIKSNLIDPTSS